MSRTWLVLDTSYLCHRAKHAMGYLEHKEEPTGVIYGLLREILHLRTIYKPTGMVFCFDSKTSLRKKLCRQYKANRKLPQDVAIMKLEVAYRRQIKLLRIKYLPMIGFKNVFLQKGYEADDIMAMVCLHVDPPSRAIIVTRDHDMYQCLRPNVWMYDPQTQKEYTEDDFKEEYRIDPEQWSLVKATAGCTSDNIKGIEGIGEKRAIQWLRDEIKTSSVFYERLTSEESELLRENNLPLVTLPYLGTKSRKLRKDKLSTEGWKKVCDMLGMKSIKGELDG